MRSNSQTGWLLNGEVAFYKESDLGHDPYAIWITRLRGLEVEKVPARLLAYANDDQSKAHIIYLDGTRGIVLSEQMSARTPNEMMG